LVGGIWLKYVVDQQLKAKDTAIQALEAVIKSKEAEISALSGNTAPAIAKDYAVMKQHANDVTEEKLRLSEHVNRLSAQLQSKAMTAPMRKLVDESQGILVAQEILDKNLGGLLFPEPVNAPDPSVETMEAIVERFVRTMEQINEEASRRHAQVDAMLFAAEQGQR
jgi:hypothetical protein